MYLIWLSVSCVHNPFPNPFLVEVIDIVVGKEAYYFIDGFSRYHQVIIVEEDKIKTRFAIDSGCFADNVMLFGLNNPHVVFSRIMVGAFKEFMHKFLELYLDALSVFNLLNKNI